MVIGEHAMLEVSRTETVSSVNGVCAVGSQRLVTVLHSLYRSDDTLPLSLLEARIDLVLRFGVVVLQTTYVVVEVGTDTARFVVFGTVGSAFMIFETVFASDVSKRTFGAPFGVWQRWLVPYSV